MAQFAAENAETVDAWSGPLFERFVRYRPIVTEGLGAHGEAAMAAHPPAPGDRVLDLGCGFGDTTLRLAGLVGDQGAAVGVDVAEPFIEVARREAEEADAGNVEFRVVDIQNGELGGPFDYAFSRMGIMFFANPVAALRNVRSALRPGATLCAVVWRRKLDNVEIPDEDKAPNSHVALNVIEDADGNELKILRDNMPFGSVKEGEFGTYYIAYAATPDVPELMLRRMFLGEPYGTYDRILDFSTPLTGSLFYVPTADFLDDLPSVQDPGQIGQGVQP